MVLTAIMAPAVLWLYGPAALGGYATFMAAVTLLVPVSTLRLPLAIPLATGDPEAQAIARVALRVASLFCLTLLLCLYAARLVPPSSGGEVWFAPLRAAAAVPLVAVFCLPAAVYTMSLSLVATSMALRRRAFGPLAQSAPLQALAVSLARMSAGLLAPASATLVLIATFAPLVQVALLGRLVNGRGAGKQHRRRGRPAGPVGDALRRQFAEAVQVIGRHRDYPLYRLPADLLHAALHAVPVLLFAGLYGPAATGYLALSRSILAAPAHLAGQSLGQALMPEYAALAHASRPLLPQMMRATRVLLALSGLLLAAALTAPVLVTYVPGEDWAATGPFIAFLSLPAAATLANQAIVRAAPVIGAQVLPLLAHAICLALYLLAIGGVSLAGGPVIVSVILMSCAGLCCQLGLMLAVVRRTRRFDRANTVPEAGPEQAGLHAVQGAL